MRNPGTARTCAVAAATAVGAVAVLLTAGTTASADPSSPVEVTVVNDEKELREGGSAGYTVTLRNRTEHDYRGLTVAQMLPASFHTSEAEPMATVKPAEATWKTDLPAKGSLKFTLKGDLGTITEQEAGHVPGGGRSADREAARTKGDGGGNGKASTRLSTSVCVQEAVTVRDGKVTHDKRDDGPDDRAGTATGGTTSGGTGDEGTGGGAPRAGNTVGRILTCDSEADLLHASDSHEGAGDPWLYGSIGAALLLAGGAGFALRRLRRRSAQSRP